jgi:hypothetical protein
MKNQQKPRVKRSSLSPDDLSDFEAASMTREEARQAESPLDPPYDPETEATEPTRAGRKSRAKVVEPEPVVLTPTEELTRRFSEWDRFRLKKMRTYIKWVKRAAEKRGYSTSEIDLWNL